MGPGGYAFAMPKWEKLEADLLAKDHSRGMHMDRTGKKLVLRAWGHIGRRREVHI